MFKNNKYTTWYFSIIDNAQKSIRTGYVEKHHIIPKSCGGSNANDNLVKLTSREHFICHLLLTKMMIEPKHIKSMCFAFHCLKYNHRTSNSYISSHAFAKLKEERSNYLKNTKMSEDAKKKISKGNTGKTRSAETKEKISQKNRGKISYFKGKQHTIESRQKISAAARGKKWSIDRREKKRNQMKNAKSTFSYGADHNKKISEAKRQKSKLNGSYRIFFNDKIYFTSNIWEFAETYDLPINTLRMLIMNPLLTAKQGKCKSMRIETIQDT